MDIENIFYQNPKFVACVYKHIRKNTFINPIILNQCSSIRVPDCYIDSNASPYINRCVNHFIWLYMLEHPENQYINTVECIRDDSDMKKMLLYGHNYAPEQAFRDLEEVEKMIKLIKWLLTYPY